MRLHEQLISVVSQEPDAVMVEVLAGREPARRYTRRQMLHAAACIASALPAQARPPKVGVVMHNGPEWVAADLALLDAGAVEVPVPLAFSAEQAAHLLQDVDLCLVDAAGERRLAEWLSSAGWGPTAHPKPLSVELDVLLAQANLPAQRIWTREPHEVCKIIHTSGTTSRPKGVMIRSEGLSHLLRSLRKRSGAGHYRRYLSLVPLSLLIEQVTAVYLTFLDGGTLVFLPPEQPLLGESGALASDMLGWLQQSRPTALTLPPALVQALLNACRARPDETPAQRCERMFGRPQAPFMACGGAPVAPEVLAALSELGLPVYEGYGLSENSSVVAWNTPGHFKAGTVGQPLDHVTVRLSADGELLVKSSSLFAGYANADPSSCEVDADGWLHTGDLAQIDDEGFVRILGRKKNLIITSNGRNVAPEWVESRYKSLSCVEQAVLFGDGLEALHGVFVVRRDVPLQEARRTIEAFGAEHLSQVERVDQVVAVHGDAGFYERCFTVTGRPRRDVIRDEFICNGSALPRALPLQVLPHGQGSGVVVVATPGDRLDRFDKQEVLRQLSETGFIVFRGFGTDIDAFSAFVQRMSSRVTLDPARSFGGQSAVAQKVDAGFDAVGLHCENGNSPFMPDLCWFFCERAPTAGSQTTVCDGYRVWQALSDDTRRAFESQAIVYCRNVDEAKWKRFAFHMLGGKKPVEAITVDDLVSQAGDPRDTTITANADGSIHYRFRVAAAHGTLFGERLSFANSILGPSYHYEKPRITFEDGNAIPEAMLREIAEVTERFTENMDWHEGDVLLIDNTRVMHGRRAIVDPQRRIFNALSYVR